MEHWHKIDKKGKTKNMSINPLRVLGWGLSGWGVKRCHLDYVWFDRRTHKWRGDNYNPKGMCLNAN